MTSPIIELRPYRDSDCGALTRLANNRRVSATLQDHFPFPYTAQDAKLWIDRNRKRDPQTAMAISVDGEFAGGIGVVLGTDIHRQSGELGYWLGEPFWGQGIATLAVTKFCSWVFENFEIVRLHAGVFENNPASARVLETAGFELEGRGRKAVIKFGQLLDELLYAKIRV